MVRSGRPSSWPSATYRALPAWAQAVLRPAAEAARARRYEQRARLVRPTLALPCADDIGRVESRAVEAVLGVLRAGDLTHFLIPRPEPRNIHLGVAAEDRSALLRQLASSGAGLHLSWQDRSRWRTLPAASAAEAEPAAPSVLWLHHSAAAVNRADIHDAARAVAVEFWVPAEAGLHVAVLRNPYASAVDLGARQVLRTARTGHTIPTFAAFAVPDMSEVRFPVDAVYLWVDDADPHWRARREATMVTLGIGAATDSLDPARFRQHDELRYSLRSLSQFAPWIRHVYLVTDRQRPAWLDVGCPRITVVDHVALMGGAGRLPTYNSHALSARLHHIDGLAEHFLYLNDDVLLGRRTGAELWFAGNGQPRFHNTSSTVSGSDLPGLPPHERARNHTLALVEQLTGRTRRRNLQHGPHPMARSLLEELEQLLPAEFARTWGSQVRAETDLVVEWLHNEYGYCRGRAVDGREVRYRYFNLGDPAVELALRRVRLRMPDTLCLNDAEGPNPAPERARIIGEFLASTYPTPSEFELPAPGRAGSG